MSDNQAAGPILIHKYPNRRYYDTRNSRHVTLPDVYDLIMSGKDVCITDSQTGEDLTNVVLMQIILERDHLKFDLFPSSLLHLMVRSSHNSLRSTVDRFFGPFLGVMAAGQKQFDSYLRETMKGMSSLDWTNGMIQGFATERARKGHAEQQPAALRGNRDEARDDRSELDDLRAELASVRRQMADLARQPAKSRAKPMKKRKARG